MALSELRISVKALAAFLFCVLVIVATNAATFYVFPRYVTRTTVLAVPITITTTSMSTTVSTATVVSYWTVTTVSTTTAIPYGQYYWWQNPYLPVEFTTTEMNWIITQSTVVITADPDPSVTTTTQTITTSIPATTTTTTLTTTTTTLPTTTTSTALTTTITSASYIQTTLTLSQVFVPGFTSSSRFSGYLKEKETGKPVAVKQIQLTILGRGGYSLTQTVTTNAAGYYEYVYSNNSGSFESAEARFNGDSLYLPSYSGKIRT
jgi:hypothetical protein